MIFQLQTPKHLHHWEEKGEKEETEGTFHRLHPAGGEEGRRRGGGEQTACNSQRGISRQTLNAAKTTNRRMQEAVQEKVGKRSRASF